MLELSVILNPVLPKNKQIKKDWYFYKPEDQSFYTIRYGSKRREIYLNDCEISGKKEFITEDNKKFVLSIDRIRCFIKNGLHTESKNLSNH